MSETQVQTEAQVVDTDNLDDFSADFFGQESKEEETPATKTTADSEQDTEDKETDSQTEAQTDDEQDEAELSEEIPEEAPKRKTVQDRIDEVIRQREELRRENAAEIAKLREELEAIKQQAVTAQPVVDENAEPDPTAVDADGEPIYPLGEFDPTYIRDLTRFTLEQERARVEAETVAAKRAAEESRALEELQTQWNARMTEAAQQYPDFQEKGRALLNGFNDLDQNYAGYLSNVIMTMERGPDVLYYLSNHPEEAAAIVNSGAQRATLALGRIEARFLESEQKAPRPKVSKAPEPPAVRSRGTNGAFIEVAPDTDDLDAFTAQFFRKK